jgi:hypothetical protein
LDKTGRSLILRYCPGIHMVELRKTTKNISHDSRFPNPDLNTGPPEYEAGVLTTRSRRSLSVTVTIIYSEIYCLWSHSTAQILQSNKHSTGATNAQLFRNILVTARLHHQKSYCGTANQRHSYYREPLTWSESYCRQRHSATQILQCIIINSITVK